jgi:hypothetical protein
MSAWLGRSALLRALGIAALLCTPAIAQQPPPPDEPPPPAAQGTTFSDAELDQMLAPVALYPDPLLAQIFMAATYPFEIAQADRWMADNPGLSGDSLQSALVNEPWDPSVKSLVAVPQVLTWMASNSQWTESLGEAFLAQGDQLMDHVQTLRQRAQARGDLSSTPQQQVADDGGYITITPADPQALYVPVYQPDVVYGPWWWSGYPPYAFAAPVGAVFVGGFFWGAPFAVGPALWGRPDWRDHRVMINTSNYSAFARTRGAPPVWRFDPAHRRGAPYRAPQLRARFGGVDPGHPNAPPANLRPPQGGTPGGLTRGPIGRPTPSPRPGTLPPGAGQFRRNEPPRAVESSGAQGAPARPPQVLTAPSQRPSTERPAPAVATPERPAPAVAIPAPRPPVERPTTAATAVAPPREINVPTAPPRQIRPPQPQVAQPQAPRPLERPPGVAQRPQAAPLRPAPGQGEARPGEARQGEARPGEAQRRD